MDTHEERLQRLQQYLEGAYSPDELGELLAYFDEAADSSALKQKIETYLAAPETFDQATTQRIDQITAQTDGYIRQLTQPAHSIPVRRILWKKPLSIAAAVLLVMLGISLYFYISKTNEADISPGYNQATLTLANGTKIALDSAQSGIIIGNEHIKYQSGASLPGVLLSGEGGKEKGGAEGSLPAGKNGAETRSTPLRSAQGDVLLALSTPKGGQYQVILEDGTKVWLNAQSTLKYPSKFTGDRREVFLEGEAFFEVNNNPSIGAMKDNRKSYLVPRKSNTPFIVKSKNQETLVLGTSFNINSYDAVIRTTLVSGAVQVASNVASQKDPYALKPTPYTLKLAPGEQSLLQKDGKVTKAKADIKKELAWKNNEFRFTDETLGGSMQQIARWYDIEIHFEDNELPQVPVSGIISRQETLSAIISLFKKATDLEYQLNGRTLTIQKK